MRQIIQLLDYIVTQEKAVLTYNASDMKLAVHSDASYLSEPNARSRAGGHFFLSSDATVPHNNGAVLNIAHIIKHVMTFEGRRRTQYYCNCNCCNSYLIPSVSSHCGYSNTDKGQTQVNFSRRIDCGTQPSSYLQVPNKINTCIYRYLIISFRSSF